MIAFLEHLLNPLTRLNNRDEIGTFLSQKDVRSLHGCQPLRFRRKVYDILCPIITLCRSEGY